jgi:hypothetical protein
MNDLLRKLTGGDLRSDGKANGLADKVIKNPQMLAKLVEGLSEPSDIVRGRTAHALERISRTCPDMLQGLIPQFARLAENEKVPMVKWHIAMIFPNLALSTKETEMVFSTLFELLEDDSVLVKSWAIAALTILARVNRDKASEVISRLRFCEKSKSIAISTKVAKALEVLENDNKSIPASWIKLKD